MPSEISGGRNSALASRALAMQPKVLLMDEPFGALDALTRAQLQESTMDIHQLGNTVIMITHDVDEAVLLSDRIVMMSNGPSARIGEIVEVALPRPRRRWNLLNTQTTTAAESGFWTFSIPRTKHRACCSTRQGLRKAYGRAAGLRGNNVHARACG